MMRSTKYILIAALVGAATPAFAQNAPQIAKGQTVYMAQKCSICHAIAGKGNVKGSLDGVGTKLSGDDLRQWIADAPGMTAKTKAPRKPAMKSYTLPKEDLDALVAYLQSLKK